MSNLSAKHFHNEKAAYKFVEARLWKDGRVCPHCGCVDRSGELKGKTTRIGLYKCYECRKPFTVKIGTIFESSRVKLNLWLQAIALVASSKKGISANQLARILGVSTKTAWFMEHRLREAMKNNNDILGGEGIVEMDETYYGKKKVQPTKTTSGRPFTGSKTGRGPASKLAIVSMVERGGKVRSFHVDRADKATVANIVVNNISKEASLYTDESRLYKGAEAHVKEHESVHHARGEYARGKVNTNSIEGFFSVFKKGMNGIFQHCDEKNLHHYLQEFDFKYNTRTALGYSDKDRTDMMLAGVVGKRLMYQRPC